MNTARSGLLQVPDQGHETQAIARVQLAAATAQLCLNVSQMQNIAD